MTPERQSISDDPVSSFMYYVYNNSRGAFYDELVDGR